ncbi:MAG: diaminopimelate decarboxylase [Persephonella sp.]|nr:MAG: diaminopimelate decarboxylase [Persephonella sp.]RUM60106.1 MAG: diaminopimelate decarboxylase [Persephonella sp.]
MFENYFFYKDGELYCENVPIKELAKEVGTPFYLYSKKAIEDKIKSYKEAFKNYPTLICYAAKSNSNLTLLKIFQKNDLGLDTVSAGEIYKGVLAGFSPEKIVYAGVGKTDREITYGIDKGIFSFNVESGQEIDVIDYLAGKLGKKANISIRVNPDVNPKTHPYISTGLRKSKFGIDIEEAVKVYKKAVKKKNLNVIGVHCHIGSQILDVSPYREAVEKVADLVFQLKKDGIELKYFDIGGGLGIKYKPEDNPPKPKDLADLILPIVKETGLQLILEPGRSLIGEAGALITQVIFTKNKKDKHFIIVDSGMNDLIRPSVYDAYHHILSVEKKNKDVVADIVGPICETGDFLALDRKIDDVERGDYLSVLSAGAYGSSMSSNYNVRPRAMEILVDGDKFFIIKEREDYDYLVEKEINPFKNLKNKI